MNIKSMKLEDLKEYGNNPRLNDGAVEYVAKSIEEFGFKVPIIIDKDNVIVAGHTRKKAAARLGLKEVPVIVADDLNADQVKAFRLADNKVAEYSEWDMDLLMIELNDIDIEMDDFGFDDAEIIEEVEEDDFEMEVPEEPESKLGQVYQLGRHRLMCGSSIDKEEVKTLVDGNVMDLVFTDPPYGMNAVSKSGVLSKTYGTDIMNDDNNDVAVESFILSQELFGGSKQVWWGANYYSHGLPDSECWIVWDKNNGGSDQTDAELAWTNFRSVVRMFTLASEKTNRVHPTQKPVKLIADIFDKFDKENTFSHVVDFFGGSGSTLMACEQMNKTCYTMELDPKYVDVIIKRWEEYTGEKAVKING